jgi:hypothetical protein
LGYKRKVSYSHYSHIQSYSIFNHINASGFSFLGFSCLSNSPQISVRGGYWYTSPVTNLRKAADTFPDPTHVIAEELQVLEIHQMKDGSRINFLKFPEPKIHDNAVMDAEQTQVAVGFVEELLDLLVIRTPLKGHAILTNAPLFIVPKGRAGRGVARDHRYA